MPMSRLTSTAALAAAMAVGSALSLSAPAHASSIFSSPVPENQNWTGSLGMDFVVNSPITINALGAYDGGDGSASINVEIFTGTGTAVPGLSTTILTTTSPYTFQSVSPVTLGPGTYQIAAWGYGPVGNYNTGISPGTQINFNTLGGALSLGLPYYNNPDVFGFATIEDNFNGAQYNPDGLHYYGAGNFEAFATPLPSTWLMLIAGFVGLGFLAYRGTKNHAAAIAAA